MSETDKEIMKEDDEWLPYIHVEVNLPGLEWKFLFEFIKFLIIII